MANINDTSSVSLGQQMELSTASAKNQMEFQREMSNTAHQREVADLKKAGLNPVLSAHGQGASTPSGAEGDFTGAKTLESEMLAVMEDISKSTTRASGKALSAVNSVAQTINKILDKYSVDTPEARIQAILNAKNGLSEPFYMTDETRDFLNNLSLTNYGVKIDSRNGSNNNSKNNKKKYSYNYNSGIPLGDLLGGLFTSESVIGNHLRQLGLYTDSFSNNYNRISNSGAVPKDSNVSRDGLLQKPIEALAKYIADGVKRTQQINAQMHANPAKTASTVIKKSSGSGSLKASSHYSSAPRGVTR